MRQEKSLNSMDEVCSCLKKEDWIGKKIEIGNFSLLKTIGIGSGLKKGDWDIASIHACVGVRAFIL